SAPEALKGVQGLLGDADAEVRAQAARVLGDGKVVAALGPLLERLQDEEPRGRFFAAQALGKLGRKEAVAPLLALARDNDDRDPYLRHAVVVGLATCADVKVLAEVATDPSVAVRRAALLALRRQGSGEVARFLADSDASVVLEAARAINDVPVESGF